MTAKAYFDLRNLLIHHEGRSLRPYKCPAGALTIGVGRNLDAQGISEQEAMQMLDNDITKFSREVRNRWPWTATAPDVVGVVLVDMAFNLGTAGLAEFRRFLAALETKNYPLAADEMLRSRWADQVGSRAFELAKMIAHATEADRLPEV